jgi:hypothetical protein
LTSGQGSARLSLGSFLAAWRSLKPAVTGSESRQMLEEDTVTNLEKVKHAGVDLQQMSPEEKQVVESLSPEEMDTLLKAKGKFDQLNKGGTPSTSLKVL